MAVGFPLELKSWPHSLLPAEEHSGVAGEWLKCLGPAAPGEAWPSSSQPQLLSASVSQPAGRGSLFHSLSFGLSNTVEELHEQKGSWKEK